MDLIEFSFVHESTWELAAKFLVDEAYVVFALSLIIMGIRLLHWIKAPLKPIAPVRFRILEAVEFAAFFLSVITFLTVECILVIQYLTPLVVAIPAQLHPLLASLHPWLDLLC